MATLLHRLGTTAFRHWPRFLAGWLVVLLALGAFSAAFAKPLSENFTIPGIPSEEAADLQAELFPGSESAFDAANVNVVVQAPEGERLTDRRQEISALVADLAALPQMPEDPQIVGPVKQAQAIEDQLVGAAEAAGADRAAVREAKADAAALSPLSEDGRTGIITFEWDVDSPTDIEETSLEALEDVMADARDAGLEVEANGPGATLISELGLTSEAIGLGVALIVLVLTFGSLVAAGMPIFNAIIGVAIGLTGVTAMTAFIDVDSSATILASMIGIAVGIDYTLFILARYRTELHHTDDREAAVGVAVGTAGSAVVFAGLTVLIALSALAVVQIPFLTTMGLAAAATVFVAVLVALTLLPAILGLFKSKTFAGRVRKYRPNHDEDGKVLNNGVRWARFVGRRPAALVAVVVLGLGALALPLGGLQLAFPTDSTAPSDSTQRQASELVADAFGPGREAPLLVVVDARDVRPKQRQAAFGDVAAWAGDLDGVVNAQVVATNAERAEDGTVTTPATGALIQVLPEFGPADAGATDLLEAMRAGESDVEEATGTDTGVTGLTAITTDVSDRLADALPVYLAIVIGLAFILLMIVFRSILVPLTATLGFLLSVLATLGATVAVFQEGAFGIFEGQPIVSFMPIFLIGLVFGLAMDYQVFLVTRMREAHVHGMSTSEAVVDGFRNSARVVTAAATIMIAVFAAFMLQEDAIVKSMGFALAAAIVFDAFIVRMVLIPALLFLLGEKAWWMPSWLDRVLPHVDVEGEKLDRPHLPAGKHALSETDLDEQPDESDMFV
ncbi:MMPL family transporter [Nocardioides marinus]|uniref:RND superfamily putative drug exporter n=1 Tax=Nocardioides marinus TaxID=374514 RepID=A0A7Y9YIU3_9ACTN|nr:MMPL family transporter [Nocardioides marinus]NYI12087.1 RND superfamily putative drug exporter [Nocardioides marinus]